MILETSYDNQPVDSETLELLMYFIYTGSANVPPQKVTSLLALSNHLGKKI